MATNGAQFSVGRPSSLRSVNKNKSKKRKNPWFLVLDETHNSIGIAIATPISTILKKSVNSQVLNLISVKVGEKAFILSGSSIHTLGEIAISKLLSPSHAAHSLSL